MPGIGKRLYQYVTIIDHLLKTENSNKVILLKRHMN